MRNSAPYRALAAFALAAFAAMMCACDDRGSGGEEPTPPPAPPEDGWEHYRERAEGSVAQCTRVFKFIPAPGQFVGDGYSATTSEEACKYAYGRLIEDKYVSLGGWGGYIVVGFDHSIPDRGGADFAVGSNTHSNGSEPGIVWVSRDANGNGVPDDDWFELQGSEASAKGYSITYHRGEPMQDIRWEDIMGAKGSIARNTWHTQPSYYPEWIASDSHTWTGSLLPSNVARHGAPWKAYGWGYVDNMGSDYKDGATLLDMANAITAEGEAAELKFIDFVKIQTGINATGGAMGELSTEVTWVREL